MAMVISMEFEVQDKSMVADTDLGKTLLRIWMISWLKLYWRRKNVGTGGIGKIKIQRGFSPLFVERLVDRQWKVSFLHSSHLFYRDFVHGMGYFDMDLCFLC